MQTNHISGKWNLASDFASYEHSGASFYELGLAKHFLQGILEICGMDL